MEQPVIFVGWGGEYSTDAIFSLCPEYFGSRTIAIFFDDKGLAARNENVQQSVGSGLTVEKIIPEGPDGKCGLILMYIDSSKVKDSIKIGGENLSTEEIGCEYAIAFYCCGEFVMSIVAFDNDLNCEELYTRSFSCK